MGGFAEAYKRTGRRAMNNLADYFEELRKEREQQERYDQYMDILNKATDYFGFADKNTMQKSADDSGGNDIPSKSLKTAEIVKNTDSYDEFLESLRSRNIDVGTIGWDEVIKNLTPNKQSDGKQNQLSNEDSGDVTQNTLRSKLNLFDWDEGIKNLTPNKQSDGKQNQNQRVQDNALSPSQSESSSQGEPSSQGEGTVTIPQEKKYEKAKAALDQYYNDIFGLMANPDLTTREQNRIGKISEILSNRVAGMEPSQKDNVQYETVKPGDGSVIAINPQNPEDFHIIKKGSSDMGDRYKVLETYKGKDGKMKITAYDKDREEVRTIDGDEFYTEPEKPAKDESDTEYGSLPDTDEFNRKLRAYFNDTTPKIQVKNEKGEFETKKMPIEQWQRERDILWNRINGHLIPETDAGNTVKGWLNRYAYDTKHLGTKGKKVEMRDLQTIKAMAMQKKYTKILSDKALKVLWNWINTLINRVGETKRG